jgi:hypothetical protein
MVWREERTMSEVAPKNATPDEVATIFELMQSSFFILVAKVMTKDEIDAMFESVETRMIAQGMSSSPTAMYRDIMDEMFNAYQDYNEKSQERNEP